MQREDGLASAQTSQLPHCVIRVLEPANQPIMDFLYHFSSISCCWIPFFPITAHKVESPLQALVSIQGGQLAIVKNWDTVLLLI